MTIRAIIQKDLINSMKALDKKKVEALRYLLSQIKDKEIEQGRKELTDQELIKLISNQIKKLEEALSLFKKSQRQDLVDKNEGEISILKSYLPQQISDQELEIEVNKIMAENPGQKIPGVLIGIAVKKLSGKADNSRISAMVMKKLGK